MGNLRRTFYGWEFTAPGIEVEILPELGGIPNRSFEFTIWFEFLGRFVLDFDFLVNAHPHRIHRAPNGDIHDGRPESCTVWPCDEHESEVDHGAL